MQTAFKFTTIINMSFYLPILSKLIHCIIYTVCIITISIVSVVIVISIHINIIVTVVITIIAGIISNFLLIASTFLCTALIRRTTAWCTSRRIAAITASRRFRVAGLGGFATSRWLTCICTRWFMQITVAAAWCLFIITSGCYTSRLRCYSNYIKYTYNYKNQY